MNQFQFAEAYVELTAKDGKFRSALAAAEVKIRKLQSSMEGMSRAAQRLFLAGTAAIGYFVKKAADAEEVMSKFNAVFKEGADEARKWAKEYADAIGRSKYDLQQYMASFQDTFVPLGFARDQAAQFSKQLTRLGLDLASFNNTAEPETMQLLASALVGNHEAVRRFGIVLTETSLKQELLNRGIKGNVQHASNMEKVLARLAIIMRSTTDAQGDALRTSDSMTNQWKRFKSQVTDLAVELGNVFVPIMKKATSQLANWLEQLKAMPSANAQAIISITSIVAGFGAMVIVIPKVLGMLAKLISVIGAGAGGGMVLAVTAMTAALGLLAAAFIDAKAKGISFGEGVADVIANLTGVENAVTKLQKDMDEMKKGSQELRDLENETANLRRQREAEWSSGGEEVQPPQTPSQEAAKRANAAQNTASRVAKELQNARDRLDSITPRRAPPGTKNWQGRPVMFYGDQDQYRREGPALKKRIGVLQNQLAYAQDEARMLSDLAKERGMAERRNAAAEGWAGTVGKARAAHDGVMSALFGDDWQKKMDAAKRELDRPLWEKILRGAVGAGAEKSESGSGLMDKAASAFASMFKKKSVEQEEKWFPPAKSKAEMPGLGTDFVGIGDLPRFMQQQITRGEQELIRIQKEQLAEAKATTEAIEDAAFDIKKELGQHFPGWGK
jgi:hypothetical protein